MRDCTAQLDPICQIGFCDETDANGCKVINFTGPYGDDCTTAGFAGGLYNFGSNAIATITNSSINNNTGASARGIYNDRNSTLTLTSGSFLNNNTANILAGGIYNTDALAILTVTGSTISGNESSSGLGGGIYNDQNAHNNLVAVYLTDKMLKRPLRAELLVAILAVLMGEEFITIN